VEELRAIRKEKNIKIKDMARELCMSEGQYTQHESGKRKFKNAERQAEFFEDFHCAIEKLVKKQQDSLTTGQTTCKKKCADEEVLVWTPLTDDTFAEAIALLRSGKCYNIIQVSVRLGVDEWEFKRKLVEEGYTVDHSEVIL
jgi:transcriptional regulator with XRE-family HTH domain